jgi:outer membrane protein TolC
VERERSAFDSTLERIATSVRSASARVRGDARLLLLYEEEILPLAEKNRETARRAYEAGQHDILRWTQSQRALLHEQRAYADVLRDYATAVADLEEAVGGSFEEDPSRAGQEEGKP